MALDELEKLRLRVEKDPGSRLFLPLAEEYRKAGMPDEAISVLLNGLERHPGYTSARVAIGRIYVEKNMMKEARSEFEKVVSVVPDNLFAHKKLADIYRDLGETEKAVSEYAEILALNPLDEEARACLDALRRPAREEPVEAYRPEEEIVPIFEGQAEEETAEEFFREVSFDEALDIEQAGEESLSFEETPGDLDGPFPESSELELPAEAAEDLTEATEEVFLPAGEPEREAAPEAVFADGGASGDSRTDSLAVDLTSADSLVAEGNYAKALETYKTMLFRRPDDRQVLQRISELKGFLKMIGKGDEIVVSRLNSLLGGIQRRFGRGE